MIGTNNASAPLNMGYEEDVRILVADDEKMMRNLLTMSLKRLGYHVTTAEDGLEAIQLFSEDTYDLVMLDVMMPNMDGFEVCEELRKSTDVPIVMLTALNRPDDIVRGLELGADNYITKPFTFKEVEARIRALLRRTIRSAQRPTFTILEKGDVKLNTQTREVTVGTHSTSLTKTEYTLLNHLMTNANQPLSKEVLLQNVWGYESADSSNLVELAIRRLRKKIEENPSKPKRLKTIRGVGYKFCAIEAKTAPARQPHTNWVPTPMSPNTMSPNTLSPSTLSPNTMSPATLSPALSPSMVAMAA